MELNLNLLILKKGFGINKCELTIQDQFSLKADQLVRFRGCFIWCFVTT